MSFHPLMMKLVVTLLDHLPPDPTVMELGNQTFDPSMFGKITEDKDKILPLLINFLDKRQYRYDREALLSFSKMDAEEAYPHTHTYYRALGFSDYQAIDVNSRYESLIMDLNVNLQENYGFTNVFDLVTNNGTGEHVFNQLTVFENMHNLTKENGVMLIVLPFHNWMNHGFYNFNPILFTDMAAVNGYEILRLSVAGNLGHEYSARIPGVEPVDIRFPWEPEDPLLDIHEFQQRGDIWPMSYRGMLWGFIQLLRGRKPFAQESRFPAAVSSLAERTPSISIVAALKKRTSEPFKMPLQGMYSGDNVELKGLREEYKDEK
jgi:SAM-dependent methyltransferase